MFLSAVLGFRACLRPVWTQSLGLELCSARTRTCNHWIQSPPTCQLDHGRKHLLEYRLWCFSPKLPGANVCRPFGWSAVSASCLLAAWLFGGSGGGAECSVHRIAARIHKPNPLPRQGHGAGEGTVHSTQYMRTHTDRHQLVDCRLHFDRTPPHVHRVCQGVAGGVWWMVWHLCGSRGRVRGSCVVFQ